MFESDEYLVNQIVVCKNRESGELLVSKYYKRVYKQIYIKTSDEELSKDLTQEVFITILKNLYQFNPQKASFKTWIVRVTDNKIIDYFRSRRHHEQIMTEILDDYEQEDSKNMENQVMDQIASEKVTQVLESHGKEISNIFKMKVSEGYTFDEISKKTGRSKSTVKNQYYSVIKKMRKELTDYE